MTNTHRQHIDKIAVANAAECRIKAAAEQVEIDYFAKIDRGRGIYAEDIIYATRCREGWLAGAAKWEEDTARASQGGKKRAKPSDLLALATRIDEGLDDEPEPDRADRYYFQRRQEYAEAVADELVIRLRDAGQTYTASALGASGSSTGTYREAMRNLAKGLRRRAAMR